LESALNARDLETMKMRKLLILSYHFPPVASSATFRMLGLARHLPKHGWQPIIVAPPRMPLEPVDEELLRKVPSEAVVSYVPYPTGRASRLLRRFAPKALWLPKALAVLSRVIQEHRPDAVFTSSPPHCVHLLGLYLKWKYRIPWLADFRDPWVTDGESNGRSLPSGWHAYWERRVMRQADVIIANTPLAAKVLTAAFPAEADKIVSVTNGFDPDCFEPAMPVRDDGIIRIVHAGELWGGRDPRPLLDALQQLTSDGRTSAANIRLSFWGKVSLKDLSETDFRLEVKRRALDEVVTVHEQIPYGDALTNMSQADVLLLLDRAGRAVGAPAKLYEYVGSGRPVLALTEVHGDSAWVLRESGVPHRIAPPKSPGEIRRALLELIAEAKKARITVAPRERLFRFTREFMAKRIASLAEECLTRDHPHLIDYRPSTQFRSTDSEKERLNRTQTGSESAHSQDDIHVCTNA
jgi:glycosyltransferase involved in cell wall biosynthesis